MKEIFIYNTKNMKNPGQIRGTYSDGPYKSRYYRVQFIRTGEVEYINLCDVHFNLEKEYFYYSPKDVIDRI